VDELSSFRQIQLLKETMKITIEDGGNGLRERLRDRLELAALLRCAVHDEPVRAITIHGRENGWFDPMWETCCETLERQAAAIVKERC
jgi:hypothetical protein